MALTLRERCCKRLTGLKGVREPYEQDWREIAKLAAPDRGRFLNSSQNQNRRRQVIRDGHGIRAFRTLEGGMTSGLSSPSRPWFALSLYDEDLLDDPEVKEWLSLVERLIGDFLARTNFYGAVKTGYLEMGLFGTEACVMTEHRVRGAVSHALTVGEYWIGLSDTLDPDTLYRRVPMSVVQAMQTFGRDAVSQRTRDAYDQSRYDQAVQCIHAIEPNHDRDPSRMDWRGKPWRSVWWDEQDDRLRVEGDDRSGTLSVSGYAEQPFWAPRWDAVGGDTYGMGPGFTALPDLRELQLQAKRKGEATDWLIKPEKVQPAGMKLRNVPGSIVDAASIDAKQVLVPYQVPYQAIGEIRGDIEENRRAIDSAAFADLFMAISSIEGTQPRTAEEIMARNDEKMTQLGSVIDRVTTEKLKVAIERTFGIMQRGRLLPPAPDALHDQDIKIVFVSILAQMQRMVGMGQIERTLGFVGNLAAVFPEAPDNVNVDEVVRDYADRAGAPAKMLRSPQEVQGLRQQRAQAQQAQQAASMAQPAQQGADAARLLSETDAGNGQSMLQQMIGQ